MLLPKYVHLTEVGPRDGLQNESAFVPSNTKIDLINLLSQTGLKSIEATSFVSAKSIPQLADGANVYGKITKSSGIIYSALVPNDQGMEHALEAKVQKICVFTAASESFTQKNIHCSIEESLKRFETVLITAKKNHIPVRGYVSCVLGCPYEGAIDSKKVAQVAEQLMQLGCDEIGLGDTIGVGTPEKTKRLIDEVTKKVPLKQIAMHFHDTYGQAIANIYASLQLGITSFDSSVSGLGGCPYAKGASGNVATEDVLYLLNELDIDTGINLKKLIDVGNFISTALNRKNGSKVAQAYLNQ
jgi:hydroxymethylglutaryl-CoA lyase